MFIKTIVAVATLALAAYAAQPGIRPVSGSREDRALTASTGSGKTYLGAREVLVDIEFPDGAAGKGRLMVFFDPSTGFFIQSLGWDRTDYPKWLSVSQAEAYSRFGVASDRLMMVQAGEQVVIAESTDKAASMDDAEAQALAWYRAHLSGLRAGEQRHGTTSLMLPSSFYPKGFLREGQAGGIPVKLVDIAHVTSDDPGGAWELTLENTETHAKVKMQIYRRFGEWTHGEIRAE